MGFLWRAKTHTSPIGIDFGTDSIKLLQVTLEASPRIIAAACFELPEAARKDADAYGQFVANALKEAMSSGKFQGKRAVGSISAAHTYTQHLRIHRSEGEALTQQIENELRGKVPLDPSMLVIRHVNVGEVFSEGANRQEVICLAVSRQDVMRTVNTVRTAGLEMVGMHGEPMAILESFAHLFRRTSDAQRTTMFVDIGAQTTKALIAHGHDLVFAKTIHVAGDQFNRHFAERMGLTQREARATRMQKGGKLDPQAPAQGVRSLNDQGMPMIDSLVHDSGRATQGHGADAPAHGTPGSPVATAAAVSSRASTMFQAHDEGEMLEALCDELHLCIGYHDSMFHDRRLDKVVFLGGESRQTKLCQSIARAVRLPAQLGDPLARLVRPEQADASRGVDLGEAQPGWAVPVGLCLLPTNL